MRFFQVHHTFALTERKSLVGFGTRQGPAISDHIKDVGGIRTQFHHVIDIGADDS